MGFWPWNIQNIFLIPKQFYVFTADSAFCHTQAKSWVGCVIGFHSSRTRTRCLYTLRVSFIRTLIIILFRFPSSLRIKFISKCRNEKSKKVSAFKFPNCYKQSSLVFSTQIWDIYKVREGASRKNCMKRKLDIIFTYHMSMTLLRVQHIKVNMKTRLCSKTWVEVCFVGCSYFC